ncbi:integrase, catalytic region, zinc finger, CCHC-type containing protein [Tanacetum coccineum]
METTCYHCSPIKDLHTSDYTQLYDFLKYNQVEVIYMQQPQPNDNYIPQPSFNQNYMQQPMIHPEDISDPTTAINMALVLITKAFKLNYSTPTNNSQRVSSNPRNMQIAQTSMNMDQDRQMQMNPGVQHVRNQNRLIVVPGIANPNVNQHGNGNVVAARAEVNGNRNNGNQIRCYNCRGMGHLARNCTIRPRRRDDAYLQTHIDIGTQTDKAPVYDSDGSAEVHEYDNCYNNEIFNMFTQEEHMEHNGGTVEQHPATVEETHAYFESLYNNLETEVEKVNSTNRKMK